jgi:hypothetical protein
MSSRMRRPICQWINEKPPIVGRPRAIRKNVERWTAKLLDM